MTRCLGRGGGARGGSFLFIVFIVVKLLIRLEPSSFPCSAPGLCGTCDKTQRTSLNTIGNQIRILEEV